MTDTVETVVHNELYTSQRALAAVLFHGGIAPVTATAAAAAAAAAAAELGVTVSGDAMVGSG
jgi:hypothetical protein